VYDYSSLTGKRKKDLYVMLSDKLLVVMWNYWKEYKPSSWLFYGKTRKEPNSPESVHQV